jgi:RNA polymerase sigma factor (TIGR02999 family)
MKDSSLHEVTILLKQNIQDEDTQSRLMEIMYLELHKMANILLSKESYNITYQATELVNEAYLKLFDKGSSDWQDRKHFLSTAVVVMRRFLVDHARKKMASKRIPKESQKTFKDTFQVEKDLDIVKLDDALTDLERLDPKQAKIVELRYFAGLSDSEIAELLGGSSSAINLEWQSAKIWLLKQMRG